MRYEIRETIGAETGWINCATCPKTARAGEHTEVVRVRTGWIVWDTVENRADSAPTRKREAARWAAQRNEE